MNLSSAYTLSQDLSESTDKLQSHQHDLKGIKTSQKIFTIGTFFIYFSFTSIIFAGVTVWHLQDYIFGNYTNVIGLTWALVTVFVVPLALSLAKHFNYQAIAKSSLEHRKQRGQVLIHSIILLALISGLYYEAISASSNLQAKAFHAVENSKAGESILNTTVSSSSTGAIAGLIADAEFKLVACQRRLADGAVKDCNNSQARLDSLKAQAQAERDSVASANVAAIGAKQEALSKERDEHALPAAKYAAELVNMSNDAGTMIIVIIAALFFELIHLTTIFNEARALRGIENETVSLKGLNGEYFRATGKTFDSGDFKDNRTIDLSDKPLNVPMEEQDYTGVDPWLQIRTRGQPYKDNRDGFGFIPKTAKLFKWQADEPVPEKQGFGFIPAHSRESKDAANRAKYPQEILFPTGKGKTADDYALIPREDFKRSGKTYREAIRTGAQEFHDTPLDKPLAPSSEPLARGMDTLKQTPSSDPLARGSDTLKQTPSSEPQAGGRDTLKLEGISVNPQAKAMHVPEGLYEAWVSAVNSSECLPSVKQSWLWIQKRIAGNQQAKMTFNNREINAIAQAFLLRAVKDGYAKINPRYTSPKCGLPKYLWSK